MSRPVQYQEGTVEFFGLSFKTDERALIPRFETEFLVSKTVSWCTHTDANRAWRIVDVGTGSGIVAVCLVIALPKAVVTAIDVSSEALALARENVIKHRVDERVVLKKGDLLDGVSGGFDVIVANLPYIPTERISRLDASVRDFEPHTALDGGPDGMDLYRRLWQQIAALPHRPALCVFEFDEGQEGIAEQEIPKYLPDAAIGIQRDGSGFIRYIVLEFK
jgi:release factor glutamine methyltransferase